MTQASALNPSPDEEWPGDWFEQVDHCLYCGGKNSQPCVAGVRDWFFGAVPGEFAYDRCASCQSLFLTRRPDQAHIALAYRSYYTHQPAPAAPPSANPAKLTARWLATFYQRSRHGANASLIDKTLGTALAFFPTYRGDLDAKLRFLPASPAKVLDYGCGNGDFLAKAAALGHHGQGVDFDEDAVRAATRRGLDVILPSQIQAAGFAGAFDMVSASHVLEHVTNPADLLRDFASWLKPGGQVHIELPNAQAAGLAQYGPFWRGLEAPRHFGIPSLAGLRQALAGAGLHITHLGAKSYAVKELWSHSHTAQQANPGLSATTQDRDLLTGNEVLICLARKS